MDEERGPADAGRAAAPLSPSGWFLLAASSLVLVVATWAWILRLPLTGADIWPILAQAGRVASNPLSVFTERYLEGVWDGATFWRPSLVAFVALERVVFGTSATPYHLVRLVLLASTALVVARSAAGVSRAPRLAGCAALAVYVLHPIQVESVPVIARDADALSALTMSLALLFLAESRRSPGTIWRLVPGLICALLAPGFKEPALLVLVLGVFVLAPWNTREPGARPSLVASGVLVAGLVAHVLARFALLGTLGRYNSDEAETGLLEGMRDLGGALVDHQGFGWPAALALLAAGLALVLGTAAGSAGHAMPAWSRRLLAAHASWVLVTATTFVTSLRFRTRYAEAVLAPLAILAAAWLASLASRALREPAWRTRCAAGLAVAALLFAILPGTPLVWRYPQWEVAGRAQDEVLAAVGSAMDEVRSSGSGASRKVGLFDVAAEPVPDSAQAVRVSVSPFPFRTARPDGRFEGGLSTAVIIGAHSIEGYVVATGREPLAEVVQGPPEIGVLSRDLPLRTEADAR